MTTFSRVPTVLAALTALFLFHCSSAPPSSEETGEALTSADSAELSNCHGIASSTIPASGKFELTSFGNSPGDNGEMACGESTKDGSWYYAASKQRFGCGAHIMIEANGKCVVAETDDYGPDECVEAAAGLPIIDASPLVAEHLFGTSSAGWSDHLDITVTKVADTVALGPCTSGTTIASKCPSTCLVCNTAGTCINKE